MSPIDDELRSALRARATAVAPAADPFPGVERRARRIRRTRAASAVAGSALAVAAVAVAVPTLTPDRTTQPGGYATHGPSATTTSPYALDPANPWEYRGDAQVLGNGSLETMRREWQTRQPGGGELQPLFGQVWEPSGVGEVVFVATGNGTTRSGLVQGYDGGRFFEQVQADSSAVVAVAVPGDEGYRLLAVAAPGTTLHYAGDGVTFRPMTANADGVATIALDGDQARDRIAVRDSAGKDIEVVDAPAPLKADFDPASGPDHDGTDMPSNVLDWPGRGGEAASGLVGEAQAAYARSRGVTDTVNARVGGTILFASSDDAGAEYLLAQFWLQGDELADTVGYVRRPNGEPELQLKSRVTHGVEVVAMIVPAAPGQSVDTLVVVPRPQTGQVEYAADGKAFRPVGESQEYLDGVVLVDRAQRADGDRLKLWDGDGVVFFEDDVRNLLCGVKECG